MTDQRDAHPDEGTIHAWLDRQLDATSSATLEAHLQRCDECAERVAEARGLIAGTSRVLAALDDERGGVAPAAPAASAPGAAGSVVTVMLDAARERNRWRRFRVTPARAAIAATIIVAVGVTITRERTGPDTVAVVPAPMSASATAPVTSPVTSPTAPGITPQAAVPLALPRLDSTAPARVAVGRAAVRAQRETTVGADLARVAQAPAPTATTPTEQTIAAAKRADAVVGVAGGVASTLSARVPAAAVIEPPQCYRVESATGTAATWGSVALPLVLALDAPATAPTARILAPNGAPTESRAVFRHAGDDSLIFTLQKTGYAGTLALGKPGDVRAGVMRSGQLQMALAAVAAPSRSTEERPVPNQSAARRERRLIDSASRATTETASAQYSATQTPAVPVVARKITCP
jgi:hypothetical protein